MSMILPVAVTARGAFAKGRVTLLAQLLARPTGIPNPTG